MALWEQDFTQVEGWLEKLRAGGVVDLRGYLAARPDEVDTAVGLIRVVHVNEAAMALLEADSPDQLLAGLPPEILTQGVRESFVEQLVAVWNQRPSVETALTSVTLRGNRIDCLLRWSAPPGGR